MTANRVLQWKPAAIVFDCDGTLMDTERHWEIAREMVLSDYGAMPTPGFGEHTKGLHYTECGRLMAEIAGVPSLADQVTDELLGTFRKLVTDHPAIKRGAEELVRRVSTFAPLAIASNCPRDVVEPGLARAKLLPYFSHVVVPEDTIRPKPRPDIYLAACRKCGVAPPHALAVEDSYCGIESATRAGLRVLGVGSDPSEQSLSVVDLWVLSLDDPRLLAWADHLAP